MAIRMNGALRLCLPVWALGGLIGFADVPAATAQWLLPPWRFAPPPGEIARRLEAQGYVLTAPLLSRPGIYLADVSAGPGGYQRLVIDARSGAILQRFVAPGRMWGPTIAARDEGLDEPPPPGVGPAPSPGFPRLPATAPAAKSAYGGPANPHIPAAISPYGAAEAPAAMKPKPKSVSTERRAPATKNSPTPPLPPPAPREAAKPDGSGWPASEPAEKHDSDQKIDSHPTEVDNVPPAAPAGRGSSAEPREKAKVSIVPPALFE